MADRPLSRRDELTWAALLVAACAVTYANGVLGAFTYDDKAIIRDNPRIRSPRNIEQIFTTPYFGGARGTGSAYRPVLLLSYAVEWWIHGKDVMAFHCVNVLFHAAATLLLAALLLRTGLSPPVVAAASLLFAVHPIHVEAVTSLVGRGETQAAILVLLYLHLALSWAGRRQAEGGRREPVITRLPPPVYRLFILALALLSYALALLTKESAAVAPALAFLLFLFLAEGSLRRRIVAALARGWPIWLLSAGVLACNLRLRAWVLGGPLRAPTSGVFELENPLAHLGTGARMANAAVILFHYLGRCIFPLHLSGDESAWSIRPLLAISPLTSSAGLLLLFLVLASLRGVPLRSATALGLLFFCIAMLPIANLLFATGTIFAERLAYLPSAGVCLVFGEAIAGIADGLDSSRRRSVLLLLGLLFAGRAVLRNAVWWTDEGLFANLIATSPNSAKAHYDVAYVALGDRRYVQALAEYSRAVEIYPGYWDAWAGLGRAQKETGRLSEAERSYERAVAANPFYENGYFGLGIVRETLGEDAGAEKAYRLGLEKLPSSLPLAYRLALLSGGRRQPSAEAAWRRALELGGGLCAVRAEHALWLWREGRTQEAAGQAREAWRRNPACVAALRLLADAAAREGRLFAEGLALERLWRVSRDRKDFERLREISKINSEYGRRFAILRPKWKV